MKIASGLAAAAMLTIGFARAARADQSCSARRRVLNLGRHHPTEANSFLGPLGSTAMVQGWLHDRRGSKFHNDWRR